MAFLKKGFKVWGKQDIQTKYKAFDTAHAAPNPSNSELVIGTINPKKKCVPAGAAVKFDSAANTYVMISATAGDITAAAINNSVFIVAEDVYAEDKGFVFWDVDDINNLEDR